MRSSKPGHGALVAIHAARGPVADPSSLRGIHPGMKACSYCGRENDASLTTCRECGTSLPDTEASVVTVQPTQAAGVCPTCGVRDDYKAGIALRGSFSWFIFFLGGFIAVLFHNASRQRRVQCNACGAFFGIRTPLSKLSLFIFWLLIAPTIVVLVFVLLSALF